MSGRNHAEQLDDGSTGAGDRVKSTSLSSYGAQPAEGGSGDEMEVVAVAAAEEGVAVPPLRDAEEEGLDMEWWDEAFLTKEIRDDKVCACSFYKSGLEIAGGG